ncbi:MAG TPA: 4Fe-4S dicluster domain-containing protein [Methanobacterium sp.]|nr:4Fe-4S dicluster domain-containing protein [Methanobacterium sp.]
MSEFCKICRKCVNKCPENAIMEGNHPDTGETGKKIIKELCQGCTVCMKECSFNQREYWQIKDRLIKE